MKTVLVTGVRGFIGQNLVVRLQTNPDIRILTFESHNTEADLWSLLDQADMVFHLAGVNRPQNEQDFQTVNTDLTQHIVNHLAATHKSTPVVLASSAQAVLDNAYGRSKKLAEDAVFAYGQLTGASVFVYRLPNVFGKWSRPNYNSVVATFCHNISRHLPIQINNPETRLALVYIDDVVNEFLEVMEGRAQRGSDGYCSVTRIFSITLQQLADLLVSFRDSRQTAVLPNMGDPLTQFLYTTYLSYMDTNELAYTPDVKSDQRGWLFEVIKSQAIGQMFVSQTKPGVTRGGHYHHTKVEKFIVVQGEAVIRLRNVNSQDITTYPVSSADLRIVDIPPGCTHDITNVGTTDLITLFWASEIFDPQRPDTYFLGVAP